MALDALAFAVVCIESSGEAVGLAQILGEQQRQSLGGGSEPPGGIDARAHAEADIAHADRRPHARDLLQRGEAGPACVFHLPQAVAHKNPVLIHQRHDVGNRRQRDEVEVFAEVHALHARGFEQGVREFEDHAGTAEVVKTRAELGIYQRHAIGAFLGRLVVVEHDDINAA